MDISLGDLHSILGGRLRLGCPPPRDGEHAAAGQIVTDSRRVQSGDVFWALSGRHRNGVDFAHEAMQRGALGVVVADRRVEPWAGAFVLEVPDTRLALWQLAHWSRRRFDGLVVAVAGSVGKSATQLMIDAVLRTQGAGIIGPRDHRDDLDVPLGVLLLEPDLDYAVLALSANGTGALDAAARLAAPQIGVITRLDESTWSASEDRVKPADNHGELLSVLGSECQAVLCGDDPALRRLATICRAPVLWYGRSGDCDVTATDVQCAGGQLHFRVQQQAFTVPVWGRHHLDAALAAIGTGLLYGCSLSEAAAALRSFKPASMHCDVKEVHGITIINDANNSSPQAARAALHMLAEHPTTGQRVALIGEMGDLGPSAPRLHYELGRGIVTAAGADRLFACGKYASQLAAGAVESGMARWRVMEATDPAACAEAARNTLTAGDVLLVKGPRDMGLAESLHWIFAASASQAA